MNGVEGSSLAFLIGVRERKERQHVSVGMPVLKGFEAGAAG